MTSRFSLLNCPLVDRSSIQHGMHTGRQQPRPQTRLDYDTLPKMDLATQTTCGSPVVCTTLCLEVERPVRAQCRGTRMSEHDVMMRDLSKVEKSKTEGRVSRYTNHANELGPRSGSHGQRSWICGQYTIYFKLAAVHKAPLSFILAVHTSKSILDCSFPETPSLDRYTDTPKPPKGQRSETQTASRLGLLLKRLTPTNNLHILKRSKPQTSTQHLRMRMKHILRARLN